MADSMGTKEASEKWGYEQSTISKWCREKRFPVLSKTEKAVRGVSQKTQNAQGK